MRTRSLIVIITVAVVGIAATLASRSLEPFIGFPGGALSGSEQSHPAEWSAATDVGTLQLETRPEDPYSVNVWGVGIAEDIYVATRAEGTGWSNNVDTNPNVRLRIGQTIYPLRAVTVSDAAERDRVLDAYVEKYDVARADMVDNAGLIYRLDAR